MPLAQAETIFSTQNLSSPVLIGWGAIINNEINLIAAADSRILIFSPFNRSYKLDTEIEVGETILSMAVGLKEQGRDKIILGTENSVLVYGRQTNDEQGLISNILSQTEPGAGFVDLALTRLSPNDAGTIIAASANKRAVYFYQSAIQADSQRFELLAIRALPGPAQKITVLERTEPATPLIAAAYQANNTSGILTLYYTERGFGEGPEQENLPALINSLTAGSVRSQLATPDELVWGGSDGSFRIVTANGELNTVLQSDNLGTNIPALAIGNIPGEKTKTLIAGTPEGLLLGYNAPIENSNPDWSIILANPVNDLKISREGLIGLGTTDGGIQVWRLTPEGFLSHVVKARETLTTIAAAYDTTINVLIETNHLENPDLIFAGQVLLIPQLS